MKKMYAVWVLAFAFALATACGAFAGTVKIGLQAPLTGKSASEGQDMLHIIEVLAEQVNAAGGINGKTVEIVAEDDAFDPKTAALAAQRLATSEVAAVIGTYGSSITEASQGIYDEEEMVQIATGSTAVRLTEKGMKYFFRTCPRNDAQGDAAAKVLKEKGYSRIAILHDNSSFAKGLAEETKARLESSSVVFFDALTPNEQDYNVILNKMKSANPDVIFFTGYYNEAGLLLRQKMEMKWNVPMLGGDATNNLDLVKIAGNDAAEGFMFISPPGVSDLTSPDAKAFLTMYQERYGNLPASIWSVFAGDAFSVLVEAIKQTGSTESDALASYLHNDLKDFSGLTGMISFDKKGDRTGKFYRLSVVNKNGEFVLQ